MKSGSKKTFKLVAATSMSLFSLLAVFSASIAWFSMNKDVRDNSLETNVESLTGRLTDIYFYPFSSGSSESGTLYFDNQSFAHYEYNWKTSSVSGDVTGVDWNLGTYSSLSPDHPLLVVFALDDEYSTGDVYIRASTPVNNFLGALKADKTPCYTLPQTELFNESTNPDGILIERKNDHDYYAFSSVCRFRYLEFDDDGYEAFSSGSSFSVSTSSLLPRVPINENEEESEPSFYSFVDVSSTEAFTFNKTPYLYQSKVGTAVSYIAVVIDFNPEAIAFIYSTYLGNAYLENNYLGQFYFACDWGLEVF